MNVIYYELGELGFDLVKEQGMYILVDQKTDKKISSLNSDMKEVIEKMGIEYNPQLDLYTISTWSIKQRWGLGHSGEF